jgi:hypothetical protein
MQRTVAIDNVRRHAALTRRLTRRQSASPGVVNWREFPPRRAAAAFEARWSASPLAASASRFAVSRAIPSGDALELLAAGQESYGAGGPLVSDAAPRPRESSHATRVRRETAGGNADKLSTASTPAPPAAPAPKFRVSRRSVAGADAARPAQGHAASPPRGLAARAFDSQPQSGRASTADASVLKAGPPKPVETAGVTARREPAPAASSRPGPHTPAANAPRSLSTAPAAGTGRSHALSRKAAGSPAARPAPPRSLAGRVGGYVSVARKHQPEGPAFSPPHALLQRKARSGGDAGKTRLSGTAPRQAVNAAHASPAGEAFVRPVAGPQAAGSYETAQNFVGVPPPAVETRRAARADDGDGAGLEPRPLTILRKVRALAPVRRVEVSHRSEDSSAGEALTRKVAPARGAESTGARPLVMRQAASTHGAAAVAPSASAETAGARGTTAAPLAGAGAPSPEIDIAQLAEQVSRIISRRLAVERERRGLWK